MAIQNLIPFPLPTLLPQFMGFKTEGEGKFKYIYEHKLDMHTIIS